MSPVDDPREYDRPPVSGRPPGGMVKVLERVGKGETITDAMKER